MIEIRQLRDVEVVAEGLEFPEGPVAMADGSVLCVEVAGGRLTRVAADGSVDVVADLGGGPNGAALGPDGAVYVCNNGGFSPESAITPGIQRVDPGTGEWEYLYTESDGRALSAPNDLVFDNAGHFWFTDFMGEAIHYAAADGSSIRPAAIDVTQPNGIGLSPAGDVLYWAQTNTRQVMRRRLTAVGELVESPGYGIANLFRKGAIDSFALLAGLPNGQELDSLAVDSGGAVCVGTLIESGVTEIAPEGGLENTVRWELPEELADPAVTNIAFGGPDLTTAYLTCSMTGRLVRCQWPRPGLALNY